MPRNKKTAPAPVIADELPDLTPQQMAFVEGILSGLTASDAYRGAYHTEAMADRTVWSSASRLRSHPGVSAWIAAARKAKLGSAVVTLADHTRELERIREIALESGNVGAAGLAEVNRGKANGLYTEHIEVSGVADPVVTLRKIAETEPDLARSLAAKHGIRLDEIGEGTRH